MVTGSRDFYLGLYTDLIIGHRGKVLNRIFEVLADLVNRFRVLISHFALLSVFLKIYLYVAMSLIIKFTRNILDFLIIIVIMKRLHYDDNIFVSVVILE